MSIPLTLIGGYLGTGKTTLVNRLLRSPHADAVAVVVNDFGDISIDADLIAATGTDTLELTNGCICCQITDDVQRTMGALAARDDIRHVICEVSGVGNPGQLGSWRTYPGFCGGPVIVCIDALLTVQRLNDAFIADVVAQQIAAADVLLMTKTGLASTEQVAATRSAAAALNPQAQVRTDDAADPGWIDELLQAPESFSASGESADGGETAGSRPAPRERDTPRDQSAPRDRHAQAHESTTVRLDGAVDLQQLAEVLGTSGLARAKGFVQDAAGTWHEVQLAGGRVHLSPAERAGSGPARLVLIASGPDASGTLTQTADRLQLLPCSAAESIT